MVPFRTAAVLASLALAGVGPATAQEHSTNPATRRFEAGPCPFKADEKILAQVRCGYLIVPENRARQQRVRAPGSVTVLGGRPRVVRLHAAIVPARRRFHPRPPSQREADAPAFETGNWQL